MGVIIKDGNTISWDQFYLEQILPEKLALDLEYLKNQSLRIDIKI